MSLGCALQSAEMKTILSVFKKQAFHLQRPGQMIRNVHLPTPKCCQLISSHICRGYFSASRPSHIFPSPANLTSSHFCVKPEGSPAVINVVYCHGCLQERCCCSQIRLTAGKPHEPGAKQPAGNPKHLRVMEGRINSLFNM